MYAPLNIIPPVQPQVIPQQIPQNPSQPIVQPNQKVVNTLNKLKKAKIVKPIPQNQQPIIEQP